MKASNLLTRQQAFNWLKRELLKYSAFALLCVDNVVVNVKILWSYSTTQVAQRSVFAPPTTEWARKLYHNSCRAYTQLSSFARRVTPVSDQMWYRYGTTSL